ncbi:MAG: glycoside hydrolase family 127 protein [Lachnospiraceae bacterium]|nr:glycoside hydrolase family 127 protein [Lachnospiraceae bacterium]
MMKTYEGFRIQDVALKDGFMMNALDKETAYLTAFSTDRLLAGFRETAGLPLKAPRYEGWESMLIGGHTLGHYLAAAAQAYVSPDTEEGKRVLLKEMLEQLGEGLLECQAHSKGKPGFIFGATMVDPSNVEKQFDNVEEGRTNIITEAWVPWYTMHKILTGLVMAYELTGIPSLLQVARGVGDWTCNRTMGWDEATNLKVLSTEFGGMNDCLYDLYRVTGEERYADAAHRFDQEALYEKVYAGGKNVLTNLHANTTIPKFIGCLNRYNTLHGRVLHGEKVDATHYLEIAKAFWTMVVENHTYVTGANSEWEHFGEDHILDKERTNCNNESCNVFNMLKLTRNLFEITGEKKYGDYYEQAFLNHVLASQDPHTGMTMYFHPMATGYFKVYGEPFNKFWCCTGSGMESFTKLGDSICYHSENTLLVQLYLACDVTWQAQNLVLRLRGDLTADPGMTFMVDTLSGDQTKADLAFRIPQWIREEPRITVNGKEVRAGQEKGYLYLPGPFARGDEITLMLPAGIRAVEAPDDGSSLAFTYGPYVLSADLGTEDEEITTTGVMVSIPARAIVESDILPLPEGVSLESFKANVDQYMTPLKAGEAGESRSFTLMDTGLIFAPHFRKVHERYGIYWYVKTREEREQILQAPGQARVIDTVQPGYGQYESDALHAMAEKNTRAVTDDGTSRQALPGGFFTYRMAVEKGKENFLTVFFRKEDNGKSIHITCRHVSIYAATLHYDGEEDLYELTVPLTEGVMNCAETVESDGKTKTMIPITFRGMADEESARVCDFIYTKVKN